MNIFDVELDELIIKVYDEVNSQLNQIETISIEEISTPIFVNIQEDYAPVQSVNGKIGWVTIDKNDVGLSNVENVSITGVSGHLQYQIDNIDTRYASQTEFNILSGNLAITGSNLQSQINNLYSSGFITGVDLSSLYPRSNPSGFITGVDLSPYATVTNLNLTGSNLQNQINQLDSTDILTEQALRISNAGTSSCTGVFVYGGEFSGRSYYYKNANTFVYWNGLNWIIDHNGDEKYLGTATTNPWQAIWSLGNGSIPLPVVTQEYLNEFEKVVVERIEALAINNNNPIFPQEAGAIPVPVYTTGNQTISGVKDFATRPTVNGTGVLLSGEAAQVDLSFTVRTTGNQTISGIKNFVTRPQVNSIGVVISGEAYPSNNPSGYITGVDLTSYAIKTNLETTGSTLNTKIDNFSGTVTSNYVTKTNGEFTNRPTVNGTGILLNGESAEYVFPDNLIVSLSSGKTFGRYRNGETILSSGKTTSQVLQLAIVEPIIPTVLLTTSSSIAFNQTGINNILNASNTINSLNASVQTGYIEWRRGGVGAWTQLTGNTLTGFSFVHSLTDTNFNTSGFNYRYIVTDTVSATNTGNLTITPAAYVSPTLSSTSIGTTPADLGNISGTLSTTINRNSLNVNLTGYQLQYQTGVSWVNIGSLTSISNSPHSLNVIHNDSSLRNINSINYRIQVYDQYQVTTLTMGTRSFLYRNYLGYSPNTSLTLSGIESLISSTLSNSKSRTVTNITAGVGNYTYYCYQAAAGDLTSIIQDGAAPVIGAFTKLSNVTGLNTYGANVTYIVYRSNATNAFTNNTLAFS